MLGCIKRHVSAGLLHTKIEEGSKTEFNRLIGNVAQVGCACSSVYGAPSAPEAMLIVYSTRKVYHRAL